MAEPRQVHGRLYHNILECPLDMKDHAQQSSFQECYRNAKRIKKIKQGTKERKTAQINIGIGINTGEALVGNMGFRTKV